MSIQSAITTPIRIVLELAFTVANRWLTTELDNPFLWPDADTGPTAHHEPSAVGPARPAHQST